MNTLVNATKKFSVGLKRINPSQVVAETHWQKIILSTKWDDPTLWFTAPETVLTALGACIMTNIAKGAMEMGLKIEDSNIEISALKRNDPLGFDDLEYTVNIKSTEPIKKLQILFDRATNNGTATNAIIEWLKPNSKLNIQP